MFRQAIKLLEPLYQANEKAERSVALQGYSDAITRGMPNSLKGQPYSPTSENQAISAYLDIVEEQQQTLKDEKTEIEQQLYLHPPSDPNPLHARKQEISEIMNRQIGERIAIAAYRTVPKPVQKPPTTQRGTSSSSGVGPTR